MNEKITVIIPVYNVEKYLDRCLESIVKQTYKNLEIILVDDGSPDNCPELCDLWQSKDSRIKVIHKKNGGLSSARNAGLDFATGDFIAFVDSDDYISENMLETMLEAALKNNIKVACCGRVRVSAQKKVEMFTLPKEQVLTGEEAIKQLLIGGSVEEACWDKLYKKEVFDNRRFPVGEINEDIVQTIEILGDCEFIIHVGKPFYYYCENVNSITTSKYSSAKRAYIKHLNQIFEYLNKNYPQLLNYFSDLELRYCQSILYLLLDNKEVLKNNQVDYIEFYERFKSAFRKTCGGKKQNFEERIKGYMIYTKTYFMIHYIKKWINI